MPCTLFTKPCPIIFRHGLHQTVTLINSSRGMCSFHTTLTHGLYQAMSMLSTFKPRLMMMLEMELTLMMLHLWTIDVAFVFLFFWSTDWELLCSFYFCLWFLLLVYLSKLHWVLVIVKAIGSLLWTSFSAKLQFFVFFEKPALGSFWLGDVLVLSFQKGWVCRTKLGSNILFLGAFFIFKNFEKWFAEVW